MAKGKINITGKIIWQSLFFIIAVALTIVFIPRERHFRYHFEEGKPWRYGLLTAPFDFAIYKSDKEIGEERKQVLESFTPYFHFNDKKGNTEIAEYRANNTSTNPDTLKIDNDIIKALKHVYRKGIISKQRHDQLISENKDKIRILEGSVATEYPTSELLTPRIAYEYILKHIDINARQTLYDKNLNLYLEPNLEYDTVTNTKSMKQLLDKVTPTAGMVQAGERIIDKGVIVSHDIYRILKSYEKTAFKYDGKIDRSMYVIAGQIIIVTAIFSFLYLFLALFRRRVFANIRKLSLIMLMILIVTLVSYTLSQQVLLGIYIVPFAVLPIIMVTFIDTRTALYASLVTIMLCCTASPFPMEYVLLQIIVSMTAIDSLKEMTKRSQLFRSVVLVLVAYYITYAGYILMTEGDLNKLNPDMFIYLGINCFLLLLSYLFVYMIEKVWGFTSNVMLVELCDLNSPLLKELSEKCPGTFQHATQVANLAAEAANAIGANALLVRTGALYHDIGKTANPMFYTENQHGINPHSTLTYKESARIIVSHVKEGMIMAKKYNLPESIKGFITTHHGISKAKYFYTMYKNEHPDEVIDEKPFSYGGPKPRTKEEGILMIADIIEAKSRSLKDFSHETLSKIVTSTIDDVIAEKQLSDTALTFRDVKDIKEVLINHLEAIYHPRISYPESK